MRPSILGGLGAEVIKVEHPATGDASRRWGPASVGGTTPIFETVNRGKKSIAVDFEDPREVERLKALIQKDIDVVVQNLRPGAAERYGLGAEELTRSSPALVYCNQSAYGRQGPLSDLPGYDPLMQAFAGIIEATGDPDGAPSRVGVSIIDIATGMWSAIGILGMLMRRTHTHGGGTVDTSLLETALAWMTLNFGTLQSTGTPPSRSGLHGPLISPNGGYRAADGLMMIVCGTDEQFARLCQVLDRLEITEDERFSTSNSRFEYRDALTHLLDEALGQQPRAYWSRRLDAVGVPCAPVQDVGEAVSHPQTGALGIIQDAPQASFQVIGLPVRLDGERPGYDRQSPSLGEHTREVLGE